MTGIITSGSRNPQGQTARAADAVRRGLEAAGVQVETVFLPAQGVEHCRRCNDDGWPRLPWLGWS